MPPGGGILFPRALYNRCVATFSRNRETPSRIPAPGRISRSFEFFLAHLQARTQPREIRTCSTLGVHESGVTKHVGASFRANRRSSINLFIIARRKKAKGRSRRILTAILIRHHLSLCDRRKDDRRQSKDEVPLAKDPARQNRQNTAEHTDT